MEKKPAHILVADDDEFLLELIKKTLEAEGFRVTPVCDGQTALDIFAKTKPDLVLLDIKMPGLDGNEVLEKIRQGSDMPVIILSGITEPDMVVRSLEIGANDYIKKPFSPNELVARVKAKLRRWEIEQKG